MIFTRLEQFPFRSLFGLALVHPLANFINLNYYYLLGLNTHWSIYKFKQMGNTEYRQAELVQYLPQMNNYMLTHCYSPLSIYRHLYNSEEIMEFKERVYSTQDADRKIQTFIARYQHIYLVSSLFLKIAGDNHCGNVQYEMSIYYQRVVTNLSKINEIPFKDALHCLAVALKGFEILYKNYGFFQIFENMFHICQRGRLKVWCNQNIYKNVPEQYLLGEGREEDMVLKIINIIDQNMDETSRVFPVRQTLSNLKKLTFANAIVALRQICRENQYNISQNLQSLQNNSRFQELLDIYSVPKRFPKDTLITFYPKNAQNAGKSSRMTPMRSSSSSSHRTGNKINPSERGRSVDLTTNKNHPGFQLTTAAQQDQFPKFIAGRQKNYSKSNSSSIKSGSASGFKVNNVQNQQRVHPHLQQFNKFNEESHIKRKNIFAEPQQHVFRYSNVPSQRIVTHPTPQKPTAYYNSPLDYSNSSNSPISSQIIYQRPSTPQPLPRQVSAPVFAPNPRYAIPSPMERSNIRFQNQPSRQTQGNIVFNQPNQPIRSIQSMQQSNQPVNFKQPGYSHQNHVQIIRNPPLQRQRPAETVQRFQLKPNLIPTQPIRQNQSISIEKRCVSVPIKVSYQGNIAKQINFSPKKNEIEKNELKINLSSSKNQKSASKERFMTLGDISAKKKPQILEKSDKKDEKFQLAQLESKIQLLESFADNKITTQQFLPNQSHALSNIKWEKSSNSGRDSVTSAFRKDILLQLSGKPSEKKGFDDWKKEQSLHRRESYKQPSKFQDNGYYTNQRLLELIKSGTNSKPLEYQKSSWEEKLKKYENKYAKQDIVKQLGTKQSQSADYYTDLYHKTNGKYSTASNNIFGEDPTTATPTFGSYDKPSFKKKTDLYINKISAISEKWQQQNICSTSNGSRGLNIQSSNIDDDILEDMHNEGFGMLFAKKLK